MKAEIIHTMHFELGRVFEDDQLLKRFHAAQNRRAKENKLLGKERPDGLRLSTDDPVRRVKQYFDPFYKVPFDQNVARRGFMVEDLVEALQGQTRPQVELDWGLGSTAFDFIDHDNQVLSVKSAFGNSGWNAKPTAANIRQEVRMLHHADRLGAEFDTDRFRIIIVGHDLVGAEYQAKIPPESFQAAADEHDGVVAAFKHWESVKRSGKDPAKSKLWNEPEYWQTKFGLESSSNAWKIDPIDATGVVEKYIRQLFNARDTYKQAASALDEAKAILKPMVLEQLQHLGLEHGKVSAYTEAIDLCIDKRGAFIIRDRKEKDAEVAA